MNQRLSALWGGVLTNRWGRIALALLAGAGAALAHPPFGILPGLLGYPLLMLLAERSRTVKGGFWVGWLAGFSYFFIGCWWVAEAFLVNKDQAWMAPFAPCWCSRIARRGSSPRNCASSRCASFSRLAAPRATWSNTSRSSCSPTPPR